MENLNLEEKVKDLKEEKIELEEKIKEKEKELIELEKKLNEKKYLLKVNNIKNEELAKDILYFVNTYEWKFMEALGVLFINRKINEYLKEVKETKEDKELLVEGKVVETLYHFLVNTSRKGIKEAEKLENVIYSVYLAKIEYEKDTQEYKIKQEELMKLEEEYNKLNNENSENKN